MKDVKVEIGKQKAIFTVTTYLIPVLLKIELDNNKIIPVKFSICYDKKDTRKYFDCIYDENGEKKSSYNTIKMDIEYFLEEIDFSKYILNKDELNECCDIIDNNIIKILEKNGIEYEE